MRLRLLLAFLLAAAAFGADSLEATLARVDQAASGFKSMTGNLRQVYHTAVINDDTVDSGEIYVKKVRPHEYRMLIQLKHPDEKTVAVAGRKAEIYYPKLKNVDEYDLGDYKGMVDQFMLLGFGSSSKDLSGGYQMKYGGAETVAGERSARLELVPKSKQVLQHLTKVELWIADSTGSPVQQKFYQPGGDYRLVTYTNVKMNAELPDSALKLQLPKGVKRSYPQKQ